MFTTFCWDKLIKDTFIGFLYGSLWEQVLFFYYLIEFIIPTAFIIDVVYEFIAIFGISF